MVVARGQAIAEADLHFVARRRVPCAVRRAVTDSRQGRPCRHRPVNTLMSATARTEAVAARVGAIERHPQFHQATDAYPSALDPYRFRLSSRPGALRRRSFCDSLRITYSSA